MSIKAYLDKLVKIYNTKDAFIEKDPISIPHRFSSKEDIEISAFLSASIAWGNRKSIIKNALKMLNLMDNSPHNFIINHKESDTKTWQGSIHRTFNTDDFKFFLLSLQNIYNNHHGLSQVFYIQPQEKNPIHAIERFRKIFLSIPHPERVSKHISSPYKGSAAKRINMFLRWMVRQDPQGVDFGLWKHISPSKLSCPLDIHSSKTARQINLLQRKNNDWKAVEELDEKLRLLDPNDPVKYDFALFGLSVNNY